MKFWILKKKKSFDVEKGPKCISHKSFTVSYFCILNTDCIIRQHLHSRWFNYSKTFSLKVSLVSLSLISSFVNNAFVLPRLPADAPLIFRHRVRVCAPVWTWYQMWDGGHHSVSPDRPESRWSDAAASANISATTALSLSSNTLHEISVRGAVMQGHAWQGDIYSSRGWFPSFLPSCCLPGLTCQWWRTGCSGV